MASRRRIDVKRILADPDLRRKLMVRTIQATQAREGIETTPEQAERAYYVVTEGERSTFFDLKAYSGGKGERDRRHEVFVLALREDIEAVRFDVARRDFSTIDVAPLAYRRVGLVAHIFKQASPLEPKWGIAAQGLATAADARFVRCWWEIPLERIGEGRDWVPFAKGGEFSRFYADVYLVVWWKDNGHDIRNFENAYIRNEEHYFKLGLTWPLASSVFNVRLLPSGCIFGHKGPAIFPGAEGDAFLLAGVLNSEMGLCFAKTLASRETIGGRWEVGVVKRIPIPLAFDGIKERIDTIVGTICDAKASWDTGNELSTNFAEPWIVRHEFVKETHDIVRRLNGLIQLEASQNELIQMCYGELNEEVYRLYGIPERARRAIQETLGERPKEVIWPQMEGKNLEQKRMEHVWRLLSYAVKRMVERDEDGIVPFEEASGERGLMDRVYGELETLFPNQSISQAEVEIVNELKRKVKGYKRVKSIREWLEDVFFQYHASLYKSRPIFWHITSWEAPGKAAFGVLVHYHRFGKDAMAKLRSVYLREAVDRFRREAALAAQANRPEERLEWLSKLEETETLDRRLQLIQEGHHEGPEGGDRDFRILTPWKAPHERPKGWDPDLDDGVKVNIQPLQKAGVLRRNDLVR